MRLSRLGSLEFGVAMSWASRRSFPKPANVGLARVVPEGSRRAGASRSSPGTSLSRTKLFAPTQETPCAEARFTQIMILPNTHVPVVVCRSAGIWTRGQLTVLGRPAAGGEPANPAQRGTRLEATTDRAFLVSAGPPKVGAQRGLSILPGVRTGLPRPNDGSDRSRLFGPRRVLATAQQLTARAVRRRLP